MKSIKRAAPFGAICIILIIILTSLNIYAQYNYIELKKENALLSDTVAEQTIAIEDLVIKNKALSSQITELTQRNIAVKGDDFKSYMSYTAITNRSSKQWELQQIAYTDENGIRCIDGAPLIAVGTGWGVNVGDAVNVTCDNGNTFTAIIGDIKADIHTDSTNITTLHNGCRCEFIVEINKLNNNIKTAGNASVLEEYKGYVVNIQKIK